MWANPRRDTAHDEYANAKEPPDAVEHRDHASEVRRVLVASDQREAEPLVVTLQLVPAGQVENPGLTGELGLDQPGPDPLSLQARDHRNGCQLPASIPMRLDLARAHDLALKLGDHEVRPVPVRGVDVGFPHDPADRAVVLFGANPDGEGTAGGK